MNKPKKATMENGRAKIGPAAKTKSKNKIYARVTKK